MCCIVYLLAIGILILAVVAVWLYQISKKKSKKLLKYIPAILFAVSIALVYFKMLFISKGFEAITDIVAMILLSIGLGIALFTAVIVEIIRLIRVCNKCQF